MTKLMLSTASCPGSSEFVCRASILAFDAVEVRGHAPLRSGGRASEGKGSGYELEDTMSRRGVWVWRVCTLFTTAFCRDRPSAASVDGDV